MNLLNLDYQLFNSIYSLSGQSRLLDFFGIFCAKYLIFVIAGIVVGWWLGLHKTKPSFSWPLIGRRKWLIFGNASLSVLLTMLLNYALGFLKFRNRPFVSFNTGRLVNPFSEKSFPSDHTAVAFALAASIFFFDKKLGVVLMILALFVGLGRIYAGVHYPFDVLGGILVGVLSAAFMKLVVFRGVKE
jgi:undecaprenyl-diphosphatase